MALLPLVLGFAWLCIADTAIPGTTSSQNTGFVSPQFIKCYAHRHYGTSSCLRSGPVIPTARSTCVSLSALTKSENPSENNELGYQQFIEDVLKGWRVVRKISSDLGGDWYQVAQIEAGDYAPPHILKVLSLKAMRGEWRLFCRINVPRSDWAASQRCGVMYFTCQTPPPSTRSCAHMQCPACVCKKVSKI